ncbi:hypothetical protein C1646_770132 [Rhizophagus diaphanus]|nr:hypothetical protein C1646_770132 [Rhizophagus diaphanus] [Rhizophagus sp. MUCL 43196]
MLGKTEIHLAMLGVHSQIVELAETDFNRIVQSSLQLFIEDNSDENIEDNNTDIMIEDTPATPITSSPIPVQSTFTEFPDLVKSPVDLAVVLEITRKEVINKSKKEMMISTLWADHAPTDFLKTSCARSFKIIQTGKGKRKLMAYFENWKTVRRVIENSQVFSPSGKELKWCQYFSPNLKKSHKTQGIPNRNKKVLNNRSLKKSQKIQPEASKTNSKLTKSCPQKQDSNNRSNKKRKGGSDSNKENSRINLRLVPPS